MDNFDELMDLPEAYVGPVIDELYRRLLERDYAQNDPELAILTAALKNIRFGAWGMTTVRTAPRKSC